MEDRKMTPREQIAEKVQGAYKLIREAEKIADESGECFDFDLAYGMGGTYTPEKAAEEYEWASSDEIDSGWMASSEMC